MPPKKSRKDAIPGYDKLHRSEVKARKKSEKKALSYLTKSKGRGRK